MGAHLPVHGELALAHVDEHVKRLLCSAVGADLPVQGDVALALVALVDELVKRLLELQE